MTEIWQIMAQIVADTLHLSPELGGIVLGLAVLTAFFVAFLVLYAVLDMHITPIALAIPIVVGLAFVGMTQWFPPWLMLFLIILAAAVIGHRFSNGGSD